MILTTLLLLARIREMLWKALLLYRETITTFHIIDKMFEGSETSYNNAYEGY
jgi:hypothetical protein